MAAILQKEILVRGCAKRAKEILQGTGHLSRDDLEYVVSAAARMKDERLQSCIAELVKWGDEERAELETMVAIGIEAMKLCTPSKLRDAARKVELRWHLGESNV